MYQRHLMQDFEEMKLLFNIGFLYLLLMYLDVAFRHLITEQKMTIEVHVRVPVLWWKLISFQDLFDMVYSSPKVELSPAKLSKNTVFSSPSFCTMQPFKKRSYTPNSNSTSLQTPWVFWPLGVLRWKQIGEHWKLHPRNCGQNDRRSWENRPRKWWGLDVGGIIVYRIMLDAYLRRMHGLLFNEILRWHVQAL